MEANKLWVNGVVCQNVESIEFTRSLDDLGTSAQDTTEKFIDFNSVLEEITVTFSIDDATCVARLWNIYFCKTRLHSARTRKIQRDQRVLARRRARRERRAR